MGSPDMRQIDGLGGAHPLTSKVAIVSISDHPDADIDYLFLQVVVDKAQVLDSQNCGNILAGVGPFAIERGLVQAGAEETGLVIHMVNTGSLCQVRVQTPGGEVEYEGTARIDGVPGTHAPIPLSFIGVEGSSCGALLPTGFPCDLIAGFEVTCIDNGMPVVVIAADALDLSGDELPEELEANQALRDRIEDIRLQAGPRMNLGDVSKKSVPKMSIVSASRNGGTLCTRTFIPHRVHEAIGVLGAVTVAAAAAVPGSVAARLLPTPLDVGDHTLEIEHPSGFFSVEITLEQGAGAELKIAKAALLRTARLLMDGQVFVPGHLCE
jgi:4-oxalomesaconate tautomerase